MNILIKENKIIAVASTIEFGIFDEPNVEKWKLLDEKNRLMYYMLDHDFELVEDVTLPEDYVDGKYFYENEEFVLDEEWRPYVSLEERLEILETTINNIWDDIAFAIENGVNEV